MNNYFQCGSIECFNSFYRKNEVAAIDATCLVIAREVRFPMALISGPQDIDSVTDSVESSRY